MSFSLPEDYKDAKEAYEKIERRGGSKHPRGGQYPIGGNNCWHSGVHIHGTMPIGPMTKGKIVACRLTDSFASIPRLINITKDEFERLGEFEQLLYRRKVDSETVVYSLASSEVDNSMEKVAAEYVLLKHQIDLPEYNGKKNLSPSLLCTWEYSRLLKN